MTEEPKRNQRILHSKLPNHKDDYQDPAEAEQTERARVGPRPSAVHYLIERVHYRCDPADEEGRACEVEFPDLLRTERSQCRDYDGDACDTDGNIHVEHPSPRGELHDGTADERTRHDRYAEDPREGTDYSGARLRGEDHGDDC